MACRESTVNSVRSKPLEGGYEVVRIIVAVFPSAAGTGVVRALYIGMRSWER